MAVRLEAPDAVAAILHQCFSHFRLVFSELRPYSENQRLSTNVQK